MSETIPSSLLNQDNPNIEQPLRFHSIVLEEMLFKDWLPTEFNRMPLPDNIRKARNKAIRLAYLEIVCCFLSFGFYEVRRAKIIMAFLILNSIFVIIGFYAKLVLSLYMLLADGCYCISVIGGFYIYIMIDFLIRGGD